MNKFDRERNEKILEILVGLKFLYIILACLNIISYYNIVLNMSTILALIASVCFIVPFVAMCSKMMYGGTKKSFLNMPKIYHIIESLIFLCIFMRLVDQVVHLNI